MGVGRGDAWETYRESQSWMYGGAVRTGNLLRLHPPFPYLPLIMSEFQGIWPEATIRHRGPASWLPRSSIARCDGQPTLEVSYPSTPSPFHHDLHQTRIARVCSRMETVMHGSFTTQCCGHASFCISPLSVHHMMDHDGARCDAWPRR